LFGNSNEPSRVKVLNESQKNNTMWHVTDPALALN
jgi:hypothetical protein